MPSTNSITGFIFQGSMSTCICVQKDAHCSACAGFSRIYRTCTNTLLHCLKCSMYHAVCRQLNPTALIPQYLGGSQQHCDTESNQRNHCLSSHMQALDPSSSTLLTATQRGLLHAHTHTAGPIHGGMNQLFACQKKCYFLQCPRSLQYGHRQLAVHLTRQ